MLWTRRANLRSWPICCHQTLSLLKGCTGLAYFLSDLELSLKMTNNILYIYITIIYYIKYILYFIYILYYIFFFYIYHFFNYILHIIYILYIIYCILLIVYIYYTYRTQGSHTYQGLSEVMIVTTSFGLRKKCKKCMLACFQDVPEIPPRVLLHWTSRCHSLKQ